MEDEALKISQKNLLSDEIVNADTDSGALYAGYKEAVEGFLATPAADMAQAATELVQHIKDYRINTADQLDKETGLLVNFIADLEGKIFAQVEKMLLTAFISNMKEFNERMIQPLSALKSARLACYNSYRDLVKMVNAIALVLGGADNASFIDYVNTEIVHYKREVLKQKATAAQTLADSAVTPPTEQAKPDDNKAW